MELMSYNTLRQLDYLDSLDQRRKMELYAADDCDAYHLKTDSLVLEGRYWCRYYQVETVNGVRLEQPVRMLNAAVTRCFAQRRLILLLLFSNDWAALREPDAIVDEIAHAMPVHTMRKHGQNRRDRIEQDPGKVLVNVRDWLKRLLPAIALPAVISACDRLKTAIAS